MYESMVSLAQEAVVTLAKAMIAVLDASVAIELVLQRQKAEKFVNSVAAAD